MEIKVKIDSKQVQKLLNCKKTLKKNLKEMDIDRLLEEAINEFYFKYGKSTN